MTACARNGLLRIVMVLALASGAGYGWHWYATPRPPTLDLAGAPPAVVEAVAAAEREVRAAPRTACAWGKLAMVLFANGYRPEAHLCFIQAERLDPDTTMWPYMQAVYLLVVERARGVEPLVRAIACGERERSADVLPLLTLAEVYIEEDRRRDAEELCRRVLAVDHAHPRAHFDLGLIALADDQPDRCIQHLTHALASPYAAARASMCLATAYRRLGDTASAAAFQRRAGELPADRPWLDPYVQKAQEHEAGPRRHDTRVEQLAQDGRSNEYFIALQESAEEAGDGLSHYRLGVALAKAGDYAAAQPVLETALRKAPELFSARFALGAVMLRRGEQWAQREPAATRERLRRAVELLGTAVAQRPAHGLAHLSLGQALRGLGRHDEALAAFRRAVACQPALADAHLALGEALAATGQSAAALRHLNQAKSLAPADPRPPAAIAALPAH